MACNYETFITRYPEFIMVPVKRINLFLSDADCDVDQSKFNDCVADRVVCSLAAHYAALGNQTANGNAGSVGPLVQKTVDKVSATYATPDMNATKGSNAYYLSTKYGQEYLALLRKYCVGILTV